MAIEQQDQTFGTEHGKSHIPNDRHIFERTSPQIRQTIPNIEEYSSNLNIRSKFIIVRFILPFNRVSRNKAACIFCHVL